MKILYILHITEMHGSTISFLALLKGMVSKGIIMVVVIPNDDVEFKKRLEKMGAKVYVVKSHSNTWQCVYNWHAIVKYPYLMTKQYIIRKKQKQEIIRIIKEEGVNLVHTNVGILYAGHYAAHSMGIPHVWHIREYGDLDFNFRMLPTKASYRRKLKEDWVITITKDLLRYNKLDNSEKAVAIYNGVRSRDDVQLETKKDKYFLCASRIAENKGHTLVIDTFIKFCQIIPDYKLVILGSGEPDYIEMLKQKVHYAGCDDKVQFLGHVDNVSDYMKKSRALIVASLAEGFGRMTAEAAFAGCPVIGHNTGGTKEILESTGGLLFSDDEELLNSMIKIANMPNEEYFSMIIKAQNIAKELYSEESYVEKVYDIYKKAMKCFEESRHRNS